MLHEIIILRKLLGIIFYDLFFGEPDTGREITGSRLMPEKSPHKPPKPDFDSQILADCVAALRQMGMSAKNARDNAELVLSSGMESSVEGVVREVLRMNAGRL